jgi:hypothetical protein
MPTHNPETRKPGIISSALTISNQSLSVKDYGQTNITGIFLRTYPNSKEFFYSEKYYKRFHILYPMYEVNGSASHPFLP